MRPVVHITVELPTTEARRQLWRHGCPAGRRGKPSRWRSARHPGGIITMAARAAGGSRPEVPAARRARRSTWRCATSSTIASCAWPQAADTYSFEDLVVDDELREALWEIIGACVRDRRTVREKWGMKGASGVSVLFQRDRAWAETMSAKVVGASSAWRFTRWTCRAVTSKWIGETEKNLSESRAAVAGPRGVLSTRPTRSSEAHHRRQTATTLRQPGDQLPPAAARALRRLAVLTQPGRPPSTPRSAAASPTTCALLPHRPRCAPSCGAAPSPARLAPLDFPRPGRKCQSSPAASSRSPPSAAPSWPPAHQAPDAGAHHRRRRAHVPRAAASWPHGHLE